ncbi:MAG TPA: hypothetical protein VF755_05765 [Catenuloplanes sp.]
MAAVRLVGVAFPITVVIMLLGVLRMAIGTALNTHPFRLDGTAVAQALGAVWLAVIIALLVVRVVSSAHPEGTRRLLVGGRMTPAGNRVFWLLFPSLLGASYLVEARLTDQLTFAAVGATLFITVVVTLIVYGFQRWQAGRQPAR